MHVIWTDKATFETKADTCSCYVSRKKDTAIKSKYLKFTFKSGRSTADIWGAIAWSIKKSVHFLTKNDRINSDIYINQMLNALRFSFYDKCVKERGFMIYMNDEIDYHISKKMIAWRRFVELKRMNWSIQFFDLNFIENLWRLIKLWISEKRHRIHTLNEIKRVIQKEWELLMKKDFRRAIKSMSDCCQAVIKTQDESIKYWFNFWISDWFWFIYKLSHFIRKFLHEMVGGRRRGKKKQFQRFSESYGHLCYPIVRVWFVFLLLTFFFAQCCFQHCNANRNYIHTWRKKNYISKHCVCYFDKRIESKIINEFNYFVRRSNTFENNVSMFDFVVRFVRLFENKKRCWIVVLFLNENK